LPADQTFPARLERALRERGHRVSIANAGVSGDTSSGGLARIDWSVPDGTDLVLLELGANDALRGIEPAVTRDALDRAIARLRERGIAVLLCGMRAPPNLGRDYTEAFDAIYPALARQHGVPLYPFFLEGVAGQSLLSQADGMHPTAEGIRTIVAGILPHVEAAVRGLSERAGQ
jgi:acyl-CoA thioesterase-1